MVGEYYPSREEVASLSFWHSQNRKPLEAYKFSS